MFVTKQETYRLHSSHLIFEDNSTFRIIIPRMDPCIGWEEDGASIKAMNDNLQQVELLAVKICKENSARTPKVMRDSEFSSIFNNVGIAQWPRQPSSNRGLHTLS